MEIKEEKETGVGMGVKPSSSSNSGGSIIQRAGTPSQPRKRSLTGIPVTPRTASMRKLSAQEASKDTHEEMDSKYCRKFGLQGQVIIKGNPFLPSSREETNMVMMMMIRFMDHG